MDTEKNRLLPNIIHAYTSNFKISLQFLLSFQIYSRFKDDLFQFFQKNIWHSGKYVSKPIIVQWILIVERKIALIL